MVSSAREANLVENHGEWLLAWAVRMDVCQNEGFRTGAEAVGLREMWGAVDELCGVRGTEPRRDGRVVRREGLRARRGQ